MAFRGSLIGLWIVAASFQRSLLCAQDQPEKSAYSLLGESERLDFLDDARRLFILGDEVQDQEKNIKRTGLLQYQEQKIQALIHLVGSLSTEDKNRGQLLRHQAAEVFQLKTPVKDWSAEFQYSLSRDRLKLAEIYQDYGAKLRDPENARYEDIISRMKIELDQKIFRVRFPIIADLRPFAGLQGSTFDRYLRIAAPDSVRNLPINILTKLRNAERLEFEEYRAYLDAIQSSFNKDAKTALIRYQLYLAYGMLPTDPTDRPLSRAGFDHHLEEVQILMRDLANSLKFNAEIDHLTRLDPVTNEVVWQLYNTSWIQPFRPNWDEALSLSLDSEELKGIFWIKYHYGGRWSKLFEVLHETPNSEPDRMTEPPLPRLHRFLNEVDEMVDQEFSAEALYFHAAYDQLRRGSWIELGPSNFAYFKLSDELRPLFLARAFPTLSLRLANTLIVKGFLSLNFDDQAEVIQNIQSNPQDLFEILKRKNVTSRKKKADIESLHLFLVDLYFRNLFPEIKDPTDLNDVEKIKLTHIIPEKIVEVPTTAAIKKRMEILIEKNRNHLDYGAFEKVPFVVDWLTINLFPETQYWPQEWMKAKEEWAIRSERREAMNQLRKLHAAVEKGAPSDDYSKANQEFEERFDNRIIDTESVGVHAASFIYGLLPHDLDGLGSIAKMAGTGALFLWGTEIFGVRVVVLAIGLDTGVRILSAEVLSGWRSDFIHLDLSKGYSLPLGKMTAEMLQDILKTADGILETPVARERLDQLEHAGEIGASFVWFGAGASMSRWASDFGALSRFHRAEDLKTQIRKIQLKIQEKRSAIISLQSELKLLDESVARIESMYGKGSLALTEVLKRRTETAQKIDLITNGTLRTYEGRLEFYFKRVLIELGRGGAFVLNPFAWARLLSGSEMNGIQAGLFDRFKRSQAIGIRQHEEFISRIETRIRELEAKGFRSESMPWLKDFRARFEIWRLEQREMISIRGLEKLEDFLQKTEKPSGPTPSAAEFADATAHYQNAVNILMKDLNALEWLAENQKMPKTLSRREVFSAKLENFRVRAENFLRSQFNLEPRTVFDPQVALATRSFFQSSYLRIKKQAEILKNYRERIEFNLRKEKSALNPEVESMLRSVDQSQASFESRATTIGKIFDASIK